MARRSTEESLQETLDRLAHQDDGLTEPSTTRDVPLVPTSSAEPRPSPTPRSDVLGPVRTRGRRARAIGIAVVLVLAAALVPWMRATVRTAGETGAQPPTSTAPSPERATASPSTSPSPMPTYEAPRSSPSSPSGVARRPSTPRLPAATARSLLDAAFGTFRPYTRSGTGPAAIALPASVAGVVEITVPDDYIVASFRDASDAPTDDSPEFVTAGTTIVPFNLVHVLEPAADARTIVVAATVPWTIRVEPMSAVTVVGRSAHGSMDTVLVSYGGAHGWTVTCPEGIWITSVSTRHDQVDESDIYVERLIFRARWAPQVLVLSPGGRWTLTAT